MAFEIPNDSPEKDFESFKDEIKNLKESEEKNLNEQGVPVTAHFEEINPEDLDETDMAFYKKLKDRKLTQEDISDRVDDLKKSGNISQQQLLAYIVNMFVIQKAEDFRRG